MSEENKPIFPRSPESSEAEKQDLRQQTADKLENVEKTFNRPFSNSVKARNCPQCKSENSFEDFFCRECGHKLNILEVTPPVPVYGPPVMKLDSANITTDSIAQLIICGNCGTRLVSTIASELPPFCGRCGNTFPSIVSLPVSTEYIPPLSPPADRPLIK